MSKKNYKEIKSPAISNNNVAGSVGIIKTVVCIMLDEINV